MEMASQYCFIISDSCGLISNSCGMISRGCGMISEGCGRISQGCGRISEGCGMFWQRKKKISEAGRLRRLGFLDATRWNRAGAGVVFKR